MSAGHRDARLVNAFAAAELPQVTLAPWCDPTDAARVHRLSAGRWRFRASAKKPAAQLCRRLPPSPLPSTVALPSSPSPPALVLRPPHSPGTGKATASPADVAATGGMPSPQPASGSGPPPPPSPSLHKSSRQLGLGHGCGLLGCQALAPDLWERRRSWLLSRRSLVRVCQPRAATDSSSSARLGSAASPKSRPVDACSPRARNLRRHVMAGGAAGRHGGRRVGRPRYVRGRCRRAAWRHSCLCWSTAARASQQSADCCSALKAAALVAVQHCGFERAEENPEAAAAARSAVALL